MSRDLHPIGVPTGRPPTGWFTKRTAEAWLRDVLDEARRGTLPGMARTGVTFADAAAEWLGFIEEDRERKPSTLVDYRSALNSHLGWREHWLGEDDADIQTTMRYLHYAPQAEDAARHSDREVCRPTRGESDRAVGPAVSAPGEHQPSRGQVVRRRVSGEADPRVPTTSTSRRDRSGRRAVSPSSQTGWLDHAYSGSGARPAALLGDR